MPSQRPDQSKNHDTIQAHSPASNSSFPLPDPIPARSFPFPRPLVPLSPRPLVPLSPVFSLFPAFSPQSSTEAKTESDVRVLRRGKLPPPQSVSPGCPAACLRTRHPTPGASIPPSHQVHNEVQSRHRNVQSCSQRPLPPWGFPWVLDALAALPETPQRL